MRSFSDPRSLIAALEKRYPCQQEAGKALRQLVVDACEKHIRCGLADTDAQRKLCSKDDFEYWQQFSEILLAEQLARAGIQPAHRNQGPDFLVEHDKKKIWIEVITPEPVGLPDEWVNHVDSSVGSFPHNEMLLRWTAAIKEKSEKLLGRADIKCGSRIGGYIKKGMVSKYDSYVIAVNGRLLRGFGGAFPDLAGISQLPFAVEATFCVGPLQVTIDRDTLETSDTRHQHRPLIPKLKGNPVPADTFLDPNFSAISAIWAMDIDESVLQGRPGPMVVVHNPIAETPIPIGFLPAHSEYVATEYGDYYQLERREGTLAVQGAESKQEDIFDQSV